MENGNLGINLVYTYAGNPTNVSTQAFNPPKGSIVIDTVTPGIWLKTSTSDNSTYIGGAGPSLTAAILAGGFTASGSASNDLSGSTGTFKSSTGLNTLSGKVAVKVIATPVAAAGSSNADAAALGSANIVTISSNSAAKGVILVTGVAGDIVEVLNTSSTAAILYPASAGTINGLSANAGVLIPASKGTLAICTAADTWTTFDLTARSTAA